MPRTENDPHYEIIDHTADSGIRVFGKDAEELFARAGTALFEQITDSGRIVPQTQHHVTVSGIDWPDLMVNWLRELLYLWTGRELLVVGVEIDKLVEFSLAATVGTVTYNPKHHMILSEIKAVTYHGIDVSHRPLGWEATIIFDI